MTKASSHAGGNFFKPLLFFAGFYLIYQPNFWTNSYVPMIITLGIAIIIGTISVRGFTDD